MVDLRGADHLRRFGRLCRGRGFKSVTITEVECLTARMAARFERVARLRRLAVYCWTTRTALRHIIGITGLEDLFLNGLRHPGWLAGWGEMRALKHLNVYGASADDLSAILAAPRLCSLTSHGVALKDACIAALAAKPELRAVDLERAQLDDPGLRTLARSRSLSSLAVPATNITAAGL